MATLYGNHMVDGADAAEDAADREAEYWERHDAGDLHDEDDGFEAWEDQQGQQR